MKTNSFQNSTVYTHEGTLSSNIPPAQKLKRLVLCAMLWEDTFYVDGKTLADQIKDTCELVSKEKVVDTAVECFEKGLLRHIPLFLIVSALKKGAKCADAIEKICKKRPDQMTEILSLYWKDGKKPLAAQLKKGLAKAFSHYDEYQLAKYDKDTPIKLRDVLFLCHAKPKDSEQEDLWKRLVNKQLKTPDTWEVRLSGGKDKEKSFTELLQENKMGKLAMVRNLRNMQESGVSKELVASRLLENKQPLLPFQFLAAAKMCPGWEDIIDQGMISSANTKERFSGTTHIFVDVSGSMDSSVSGKSQINRIDAACGLAILLRERCEDPHVWSFSERLVNIPIRHGMALRDAICNSQGHSGTYLGNALTVWMRNIKHSKEDRVIIITDEQTTDPIPPILCDKIYVLNIGTYENGIKNQKNMVTISGFSEYVIDYIYSLENLE